MKILNCEFDSMGQQQFLNWVDEHLRRGARGQVSTIDVARLMEMEASAAPHRPEGRTNLTLCGSRWIYWLSQLLRRPLNGCFDSADLVQSVCQSAVAKQRSVFFIGSDRNSVYEVGKSMKSRFPELSISGIQHEYFEEEYTDEVVDWIRESGTGILVVDMDSHRQSTFLTKYQNELDVDLLVQVPGAFAMLNGKQPSTKDLQILKFIGYSMFELLIKAPFVDAWNKTKFNSNRATHQPSHG